ncbi:hypothetical protein SAMN05443582_103598 [Phyllobacterium sp. OV277]|nr:hypothetical protein SAMN05443582_103598 [Phyllobacterium sp. OV277]
MIVANVAGCDSLQSSLSLMVSLSNHGIWFCNLFDVQAFDRWKDGTTLTLPLVGRG